MPDNNDIDDVRFSRGGNADIFGKLDDDLPSIRINGDVLDHMRRDARNAGVNLSEYIRTKLYVSVYGIAHIASLQQQQLQRVMGNASQMQPNTLPPLAGE